MTTATEPRRIETYVEGTIVHATVEIAADCVDVDPEGLSVTVRTPDKAVTTYVYGMDAEVVKDSPGNYFIDLDTSGFPGRWVYYWKGTGNNAGADRWEFVVTANPTLDDEDEVPGP